MKILHAAFGFIDVFLGSGWENHSRLRQVKTKDGHRLVHISGIRLNHSQLVQVNKNASK